MTALPTATDVAYLSASIHADNVAAGWWTDLDSNESLVGRRNMGELLMLCVTEISEADEGFVIGAMDDKLPHRQMIEVELADCAIRLFDLIGGFNLRVAEAYGNKVTALFLSAPPVQPCPSYHDVRGGLLTIVNGLSHAMEAYRKGRYLPDGEPQLEEALALTLLAIFELGRVCSLDVNSAIAEKRAFNATRADHKPENRRAAGGKKV